MEVGQDGFHRRYDRGTCHAPGVPFRMTEAEIARALAPILKEVSERASVAGSFIDKDSYRIYLATVWANIVMDPSALGVDEEELENVHDLINLSAQQVLGEDEAIAGCFRFINSRAGELAMDKAKVSKTHRQLLLYFSSMILDPDGHRRWMEDVKERRRNPGRAL